MLLGRVAVGSRPSLRGLHRRPSRYVAPAGQRQTAEGNSHVHSGVVVFTVVSRNQNALRNLARSPSRFQFSPLGCLECLLGLALALFAYVMAITANRHPLWSAPRVSRAPTAAAALVLAADLVLLLAPGLLLFTRLQWRWWPQTLPLLMFAALAFYLVTHWV